jgi:hypothetical protein
MARRLDAALLGLYMALLAALTALLWLALVVWFPTPLPAADAHGLPEPPRRPAPYVAQATPWWRGEAAGIVGAYAAGGAGVLTGAVVATWRERTRERKPSAA